MRVLLIILIAVANCVLMGALSLMALEAFEKVFAVGLAWIAGATVLALLLAMRRSPVASVLIAVMTLPAGLTVAMCVHSASRAAEKRMPVPPAFAALCRQAGPRFISAPSASVTSIGYDWTDPYPPPYNHIDLDDRDNVTGIQGGSGSSLWPPAIAFVESRVGRYESVAGGAPYVRRSRDDSSVGIAALTADARVLLRSTLVTGDGIMPGTMQYDVEVSDYRDGRKLATLRYFLADEKRHACGETSPHEIDERAFVYQAVGAR